MTGWGGVVPLTLAEQIEHARAILSESGGELLLDGLLRILILLRHLHPRHLDPRRRVERQAVWLGGMHGGEANRIEGREVDDKSFGLLLPGEAAVDVGDRGHPEVIAQRAVVVILKLGEQLSGGRK